jgi:D-glycero-alpha-D-manno-heptose-7-phosphate kinase
MIISQTPFRVSFAGGGTDMPDFYRLYGHGAVVSSAIDKYVYLAIHRYFERQFLLKYSKTETCDHIDDIRHPLIRECLRSANTKEFLEISSFADIPAAGSGLGSSSAFTVGLLNALFALQGRAASRETCATLACDIEIDRLGEPIGRQDQYAAAYGGFNYLRFQADDSVQVEPIILERSVRTALEDRLLLFYTGITRKAGDVLTEQRNNLRADPRRIEALLRMRDQADRLREALHSARLHELGEILHEGWVLKKSLASAISSGPLDEIYTTARSSGASGGKILGAGGGGFFLFYVEPERQDAVIKSLSNLRRVEFRLERQGTRIIYAGD